MVVATGFFDGVHLGHRFLLDKLVRSAEQLGCTSTVVTFWPHPRNVLQDDARNLRLLTSMSEKRELLSAAGIDKVEVLTFNKDFSKLTAEEYLRDYIIGRLGGKAILLGYDNRMGSDRRSPEEAAEIAEKLGLQVIRADVLSGNAGVNISSTKIRGALASGKVEEANVMLGYDYSLHGVVVAGNRLGRTIGFPTANISLYEPLKLVPAGGVYLVRVDTVGRQMYGMCNIGVRPTVGNGNHTTIETHIFDFDEDIYGLDIRISFIQRIRDEKTFPCLADLSAQLASDKAFCESLLSKTQSLKE